MLSRLVIVGIYLSCYRSTRNLMIRVFTTVMCIQHFEMHLHKKTWLLNSTTDL